MIRRRIALPLIVLLMAIPQASLSNEGEKKEKDKDVLEEEFSELEDADYPDLVAVDEESELMDELTFLEDAGMVESAARHRQEIGMSPSAITVITRDDIAVSGATSFADLLRMVPGMGIIVPTASYPACVGRIFWTVENYYFLMLIDGREANIELLGSSFFEIQPIFLEDIERIEIIRGPGSSLYGANAVTGVISVTTRAVKDGAGPAAGWARLAGGEAGLVVAGGRLSTRVGKWGLSVGGGGDFMGVYTDPRTRDKHMWKLRALVEHRWSETERFILDAGVSKGSASIHSALGRLDVNADLRTLRLAYESEDLRGHVYWTHLPSSLHMDLPMEFAGIRLARPVPMTANMHIVDGEVQWTLPQLWAPLLVIVGGVGRASWLGSDQMLDAETYADPTSARYHEPGVSHWEVRAGAFLHVELALTDWVTVTSGVRFDYNTETELFLSPRLAAIFRPAAGQFFRLGVARAFRKPAFLETGAHFMVEFPGGSPITGPDQEKFQEFMTRVIGNSDLGNEELVSFEAGYMGKFLGGRLSVALDLYYNLFRHGVGTDLKIVTNEQGMLDLDKSSAMLVNTDKGIDILGGEFSLHLDVSKNVSLMAYWDHREVFDHETGQTRDSSPKNLLALGGRFRTSSGLLGSLYAFSRSEFRDRSVANPDALFESDLTQKMDNVILLLGRLGWRWGSRTGWQVEAGIKLLLPVSPFRAPHFRFREEGGGMTAAGQPYGGVELARMVTGYLEGSF